MDIKEKFTQGNWGLMEKGFTKGGEPNMIQVYATNDDLEMICKVYKDGILHNREQDTMANAKLLVSSPKLFRSLQKSINLLKRTTEYDVLEKYKTEVTELEDLLKEISS